MRRIPDTTDRVALAPMIALALLAGLGGAPGAAEEARPQPARLVFSAEEHDFGRVRQGDVVAAEFAFANRGDVELSLSAPRVACDCSAELSPTGEIAPGGSGVLRVRFDTDAVHGPQRRTVTLYSNDPDRRSVMLTLHGEVTLDVVAEPAELYVGDVTPGTRVDTLPVIRTGASTSARTAVSDGPCLGARLGEEDGRTVVLLEIRADAPAGPFTQTVRVATSSERHPSIEIPVYGIVVDAPEPSRWPGN
jgi:hypothetical protein